MKRISFNNNARSGCPVCHRTEQAEEPYDFTVTDIDGKRCNLSQFKGKKVMIVNVASKCGLTPQYELLQELCDEYKDRDWSSGFPANNFKGQEPGSNK